jgi:hypothetical protein
MDFDMNIQAEEDAEQEVQIMDLDLNKMPVQDPDLITIDNACLKAENSETYVTSISISAASLPSSESIQGNLNE